MDVILYVVPNTAPVFINLPASHTVDASSVVMGTVVYDVSAYDNDSSVVTYSMTSSPSSPNLFSIDAVSGEVSTLKDLIYAVDNAYILTISATDSLDTTTDILTLSLTNVNVAPTIPSLPDTVYIDEDQAISNTILFAFPGYDPDAADSIQVTYTVLPVAYSYKFTYDSSKGKQRVKVETGESLDYELQSTYLIQVMISDGKAETGPHNLTIIVNDVNEVCVFDSPFYYATMDEGLAGVITDDPGISVTDVDVGDTTSLSIDYLASTESSYFSIDDVTGVLTFAVDYDVDSGVYPSYVILTVVCTDSHSLTGTTTLNVTIEDINDNAPQFTLTGYTSYINQYDGPSSTVKDLSQVCTDDDSGLNALIDYTWVALTSGSGSYFHLSPSGEVSLLVYPSVTMTFGDIHSFTVTATDQGAPTLSGYATVHIIYRDWNNTLVTTTTTLPTVTSAADDSTSFWDDYGNIVAVALAALFGLILTAILLYFCVKYLRKWNKARVKQPKIPKQKVKPLPKAEKTEFDFWNNKNSDIGQVAKLQQSLPKPSVN